jgi:hypothetical protein
MVRRFCEPRRLVLSALAAVLAILWIGNAAMTIWLRESASPDTLRALLAGGLVVYAAWHFTQAALFRPGDPFDWKTAERELLAAAPLSPCDLVGYQLASVAVSTLLKAALFTLLLLPDLRSLALGFAGIVLALYCLEVLRMAVQIVTWGMSGAAFLAYRAAVVAGLVAAGSAATWLVLRGMQASGRLDVGEGVLERFVQILVQLDASPLGYVRLPFQPFVELIVAPAFTAGTSILGLAAIAIVAGGCASVVWSFAAIGKLKAIRERDAYRVFAPQIGGAHVDQANERPMPRILRLAGAGPLAWRQLVAARRHWGNLLTAMIAPAILASLPSFVVEDPYIAFLATTGALSFYTLLLLPTALRFDFRRDLDRLATLKGLPITPAATVIGQTLAPVAITTVFQAAVVAFALAVESLPLYLLPVTMLILLPMNAFIFGLDNLIYLLYPYRMQQEGLEIFLRTMLTFTGKGILFAVGLAAMSAWGFVAATLCRGVTSWTGASINAYAVFAAGLIAGMSFSAVLVLYATSRTYGRLDPIEDLPR